MSVLGSAVQMAAFGYCLYLLWSGKILYGTMTLFLSQGTKLSSAFNALVRTVPSFLSASVSARAPGTWFALEPDRCCRTTAWTGGFPGLHRGGGGVSYG